ncbi:uncharacterized protein LOC111005612 isoform X2 [Momordica charantia]|uniref:Uncharacterized protein LOC111005612 isoform X2 n=1 Tax=Momordica charantia TaxID=3673 RepID=A0A6J1BTH7_MOMCH|nr:uncharacterized protein LOC111005612 isoform X2 [Momordica charantia]
MVEGGLAGARITDLSGPPFLTLQIIDTKEKEDGRRFVAYAFGLSRQLSKETLAIIRSQIPFGRKSMLEAYGDILFRAWRNSEGDTRDEIENGFLQSLVEGAIHSSTTAFGASIRRVLGGFVNQRTVDGVEKLLFRITEPLIFRSLQVANSNVRQNALHLLLDVFPLENPDATKERKDTLLDRQFFLIEKLLMDDSQDVRVVAVEGCCRILCLFWEIIPSSTITKIITKIFDEMSHDTSNEVRFSTLNGIIYLFGNPQSHEVLKVVLPRLGHLMLDNALSVRVALADLLLLIRDVRNFQFNKVVSLDLLLEVLANDQHIISQKITRLLMPSYFPTKVSVEEACSRCITLIKRSPMAGARFCQFSVSEGASLKSIMELVRVIINLVLSSAKLDTNYIDGLLLSAEYLCSSILSEPCYKNNLKDLFIGEQLKSLLSVAQSGHARSSIFNIVSLFSPNGFTDLLEEGMRLIINCRGLSENLEKQAEVRSGHKFFLSCDELDVMFEAMALILQKSAYRCHIKFGTPNLGVSPAKRKKCKLSGKILSRLKHFGGKKHLSFEDDYLIAVGMAWQVKDLLLDEEMKSGLLSSQTIETIFLTLKVICEVCIVQCVDYEFMDVSPVLAYASLALHMTLQNGSQSIMSTSGAKNKIATDSSSSEALLEETLDHLLKCIEKLYVSEDIRKPDVELTRGNRKLAEQVEQKHKESGIDHSHPLEGGCVDVSKKTVKQGTILTAVLKFIVDAISMGFLSQKYELCLKFTTKYMQYIIWILGQEGYKDIQFEEMKEIILCLKSSLSYAGKLLNQIQRHVQDSSMLTQQLSYLANNLLDLIASTELHLGPGYAARLVAAAKPWLPDLILALRAGSIMRQVEGKEAHVDLFDQTKLYFPSWLSTVAKIELSGMTEDSTEEDDDDRFSDRHDFPIFNKFIRMIVTFLKRDHHILDAVGVVFMMGSEVGLERKDFGLVLGLLQFVCQSLYCADNRDWGDMMLTTLQRCYPQIEREIEQCNEDGRHQLDRAKALLEPVWLYHIFETGKLSMMDE